MSNLTASKISENASTDISAIFNRRLSILQYNMHKSKDVVMKSCPKDKKVRKIDIQAIQEPWLNVYMATAYYPIKIMFRLIYLDPEKKVDKMTVSICFFVNKQIPMTDFNIFFYSGDLVTMKIWLINVAIIVNQYLQVPNLYNKPSTEPSLTFVELQIALKEEGIFINKRSESYTQHIIVKEFNIYHPIWRGNKTRANNQKAELVALIDELKFIL